MRQFTDFPPLLTVEELGELLRVSPKAVYAMVRRGQVKGAIKVGRRLRFDRDAVLEWLGRAPSPTTNKE